MGGLEWLSQSAGKARHFAIAVARSAGRQRPPDCSSLSQQLWMLLVRNVQKELDEAVAGSGIGGILQL